MYLLSNNDVAVWKLRIKIRFQWQQPSLVSFSRMIIFFIIKCPIVSSLCNEFIVSVILSYLVFLNIECIYAEYVTIL